MLGRLKVNYIEWYHGNLILTSNTVTQTKPNKTKQRNNYHSPGGIGQQDPSCACPLLPLVRTALTRAPFPPPRIKSVGLAAEVAVSKHGRHDLGQEMVLPRDLGQAARAHRGQRREAAVLPRKVVTVPDKLGGHERGQAAVFPR